MSELASLLRMHAAENGNARRASRVRHLYLSDEPLMLLPLKRTGPAARPLAFMLGTRSSRPRLLTAPPSGPVDRVLADLAEAVNSCITSHHGPKEHRSKSGSARYTSAPQLLVPNPRSAKFLQQLGLNLSFRHRDCQDPTTRSIRRLGQWLTYFTTRAEIPGSAALIPLTKLLAMHWITGQSPQDDEDLATVLAWIYPEPGRTGREAACQAEAPDTYRPAGPATDAAFDNEELVPLFHGYTRNPDGPALQNLRQLLAAYLEPTWDRMWQAYQLLKAIPQTPSAVRRWGTERGEFTKQSDFLERDGRSRPARDSAAAACTGFELREREATAFNIDRAREDPFVRAELRSTGEAVGGTVTAVDTQHTQPGAGGQDLWRPTLTLVTKDLVSLESGRLLANHLYRAARYRVTEAVPRGEHTLVHLEITAGMGYVDRPNLAVLPAVGDFLELTPAPQHFRLPVLPRPDQIPWTHRADSTRPQHLPMRGEATPSAGRMPPAEPDIPTVLTEPGALTHRGMVVHAPPGAGKSTLVVHATDHLVRQGTPCAVIAQTNNQVDQLVRRIAKTFPRLSIGRLTATTHTLPDDLRKLPRVRASTSIKRLNDADITIGTAEKWASLTDATDKRWPWAIIDEAYQMRSSTLLHTAHRFDQILFVGDPGQLAPFSQIDTARWAGLPHHPIASAATVVRDTNPGLPVRHLPVSWRLPPSAVPLINSAFYPSEPFRAGTREADRALTFTARGIRAPSLDATIEHAAETGWALLELPARYTPRLDHEALHTILALAERLLTRQAALTCENEPQRKPVRPADITIGTAHSIQAERLRTLRAQNYPHMRGITIDTANRLQGHEASISLILHPLSGRMDASAFHLEAGRLCVLMSRHRQSCIVVARARIANILDTHPGDEPVHLGTPSKLADGWESHHTVMEHLSHHTIRAQAPP